MLVKCTYMRCSPDKKQVSRLCVLRSLFPVGIKRWFPRDSRPFIAFYSKQMAVCQQLAMKRTMTLPYFVAKVVKILLVAYPAA